MSAVVELEREDAFSEMGYRSGKAVVAEQVEQVEQDAAEEAAFQQLPLVEAAVFSLEHQKLVDFVHSGTGDAAKVYGNQDREAGSRYRAFLRKTTLYVDWLRLDSLAQEQGEERPEPFDWSGG